MSVQHIRAVALVKRLDATIGPGTGIRSRPVPTRTPFLERLGLHRPELRAWALYDWANSAFFLVIVTGLFPVYYQKVAAAGMEAERANLFFSWTTSAALALAAFAGPILGALADFLGKRKLLMAIFIAVGVGATLGMGAVREGDWVLALALFALGNVGVSISFVFYDAFLPYLASADEMDRVSTAGYAIGYLGSGLLFIGNLWAVQHPEALGLDRGAAIRLSFVSVAVWWTVFSIPFFRRIVEPPRSLESDESSAAGAIRVTFTRLGETLRELRGSYKQAFLMLLATLVYNDGVSTIIRMATIYAATRGLPDDQVILAVLLVQFVGIPFAFLFGQIAGRFGAKRSILVALGVYCVISVLAYRMETIGEFYVLAGLVGTVQGGVQALSRSLFASMVPKHKSAELFGFFSVFERFASILGPLTFALVIAVTGSSRSAILSVIVFFVVGGAILLRVDVEQGRAEARASDAGLVPGT